MMPSSLTIRSSPSDTDRSPVRLEANANCEMTNDIIFWSPLRGYYHLHGCIICDALAVHLPENESLLNNSVVATFQRNNYELSLTDKATQDLQEEVERLCGVVIGLQEELADYWQADASADASTNGYEVSVTDEIKQDVSRYSSEQ